MAKLLTESVVSLSSLPLRTQGGGAKQGELSKHIFWEMRHPALRNDVCSAVSGLETVLQYLISFDLIR